MAAWQEIKVSSKILGHISAGVYRSPGGALKELVSNAFDADATRVDITTNWPSFDIITCRDNGDGMTQQKFEAIMKREIGDSTKRPPTGEDRTDTIDSQRPIIGWLGIGMLGVAQICHEFKVISHHKETETAFSASIRLADFRQEKKLEITSDDATGHPIDAGEYMIEPIEYDPDEAGTYVIASDMRSAFVTKFRDTSGDDPLPSKFSRFLREIHSARSVKALSDYWQMVWELTVACPLPYADHGPFDWDKIVLEPEFKKKDLLDLNQSLNEYQFEVVVDGLSLRKPNQYPLVSPQSPRDESTTGQLFQVNSAETVYGRPLKLSGYIYLQNSRAVEPMELRGLLVRIRNVSIGTYDPTFFGYPSVATPRFNWISGEIYVQEGLEFALNIDRDSFNEMNPHFVKLQELLHHLLRTKVFPSAEKGQRQRSKETRKSRESRIQETLKTLIRDELGYDYVSNAKDEQRFPVIIDTYKDLVFENDQSTLLPNSRSKRKMIQAIAHAFEISMLAPEDERRERFYQLLSKLVKLDLL